MFITGWCAGLVSCLLNINVRTAEQPGVHEGWERFMKPHALAVKL